jgi:AraC-like DNA-binding protein
LHYLQPAMKEFCFEYTLNDLVDYAQDLAHEFGKPLEGNILHYPQHIAAGHSSFYKVDDFISFQIARYHTKQRLIFKRQAHPHSKNHLTISFQEFTFASRGAAGKNADEVIFYNNGLGSVLCKSVTVSECMIVEPDTEVRVLLVLLKENWVENVLKNDDYKEKFRRYFGGSEANFRKEFLGPQQLEVLKEIFMPAENRAITGMFYISRVMNLLEGFLTEVLQKDDLEGRLLFARADDIKKMQMVETFITDNINQPFSGVDFLSRWCYMSRTKFINLFQKVYGMSSYEYYQRKRLNIAYDSLKSGGQSIAEVAESIGYTSVANFTIAFKKIFGRQPKELLQKDMPEGYN